MVYIMKKICAGILLIALFLISSFNAVGQNTIKTDTTKFTPQFAELVKVSGVFYLASTYVHGSENQEFDFSVRRAYLTVRANIAKNLSVRYTQDITIDNEGADAGNVELRIKYAYMQYNLPDYLFFSNNHLRFGVTQRPWFDYEEHINVYRVQGPMFLERSGLFNSSGFGLSYEGYLGDKLSGDYVRHVNSHYPGKYGSFSLGIFNGGGYHLLEKNLNKTFEARISLRPLPSSLPGLQFSYLGVYGKGNLASSPEFVVNVGYVSYENHFFTLTAQYEQGTGNSTGFYVDSNLVALPHHGYSLYGEFRIPKTSLALYGRYDYFNLKGETIIITRRQIYGISWRFLKQNKVVFTYQKGAAFANTDIRLYDLALDVSF